MVPFRYNRPLSSYACRARQRSHIAVLDQMIVVLFVTAAHNYQNLVFSWLLSFRKQERSIDRMTISEDDNVQEEKSRDELYR